MKAPFSPDGSLLHYADEWTTRIKETEWREAEPFTEKLTLTGTRRGRSAAYFIWRADDGRTFPMFMTDIFDLASRGAIIHGCALEKWVVRKRGANYGIRMANS